MRTPRKAAALLLAATLLTVVATPALAAKGGRPKPTSTTTTTVKPTTSTTAASGTTLRLDWSPNADMSNSKPLHGATVSASKAYVRMAVVNAPKAINVVKWYVNGALHRDDDINATYDLQFDGYAFPAGTDTVKATIVYTDSTTEDVLATFTESTTTSTTVQPTTTTTVQPTTTTTAPSNTGPLPFPGPGTVGHLA